MTMLPLGIGAYKRTQAGEPEIKLVNRYVEQDPANLEEHTALLSRPGTNILNSYPPDDLSKRIRGNYSKRGIFNSDLFTVSGENLYRTASDGTKTQITGQIKKTGHPSVCFDKGEGYERMFIADGQLLQYYDGGSYATGTMTTPGGDPTASITSQVIQIGSVYYGFTSGDVNAGSPDGTAAKPFLCNPGSDPVVALANMISFIGTPGTDWSNTIGGANTEVTVTADTGVSPAVTMTLESRDQTTAANSIATAMYAGSTFSFSGATLTGGGVETVHGINIPTGEAALSVANLAHFILVSIAGTQKFFFLRPGATTIDALDFASKESQPDPIIDMQSVGDFVLIMGAGSTETWYATGANDAPLAPQQGRGYARGVVEGTPVVVNESVILVGNDWRVYSIGSGIGRISDHGIEERIRRQLRRENGLT